MIRRASSSSAENWADFLPSTMGDLRPPVDLHAVARHRQIRKLGLRFMVPRGLLLPVDGGFEVYLRNVDRDDIDLARPELHSLLSSRQRFSFAHEIAHTLFYDLSGAVPTPDANAPNPLELERTCDRVAGKILVPVRLLKREIAAALGKRMTHI